MPIFKWPKGVSLEDLFTYYQIKIRDGSKCFGMISPRYTKYNSALHERQRVLIAEAKVRLVLDRVWLLERSASLFYKRSVDRIDQG